MMRPARRQEADGDLGALAVAVGCARGGPWPGPRRAADPARAALNSSTTARSRSGKPTGELRMGEGAAR
jgi:hypothetical protein